MKANAAQAMPIAFLAMHEEKREGNRECLEVWEEVWNEGTPGTEGGIRLYLTEIISLLSVAIEAPQWKVKAEAARAMGTVAVKLDQAIPPKEQKRLLTLLLNALAGRTWTGKEAILRALSDVCKGGSSSIRGMLLGEAMEEEESANIDENTLVQCLFKECRKEKLDYKIIAIECTGIIFKELQILKFSELFEMIFPIIKKKPEEEGDSDTKMQLVEESKPSFELQHAVIKCLGLAWPQNDTVTQQKHISELLESLNALVQATTRQNQICITTCLGEIVTRWKVDPEQDELNGKVIAEIAQLLSTVLVVPKSLQLRSESLIVLGKVVKLLISETCKNTPRMVYIFRDEVAKSLDYVIKDLGSDHASKDTARELKNSLMEISFASS
jgi:proteasome component ECM29